MTSRVGHCLWQKSNAVLQWGADHHTLWLRVQMCDVSTLKQLIYSTSQRAETCKQEESQMTSQT